MKRRLLPLCTALVLCLLLAPPRGPLFTPTLPLKPCTSAVTTGRKSKKIPITWSAAKPSPLRVPTQTTTIFITRRGRSPCARRRCGLPSCTRRDHHPLGGRKHHWHERLPHRRGHPRRHPRSHHHHWPRLLLHSQQRRRHHHGTARQRHRPPSDK